MGNKAYSDDEINEFLEVAQEIGIGRAIRKLKYPNSWATAQRWALARGVEVALDDLKARSKAYHDWYETEDALLVAQEGMKRVYDELLTSNLNPEEQKKLSEAFQKYANTWMTLQGKASVISEKRETDSMDSSLVELLNMERAKNHLESQENIVSDS